MRIVRNLLLALLVLLVLLAGAGTWFVRRPLPQVSGTLAVAGLQAQVQVIRDRWGVPNIYAENERDLFFAQGYVHAQDRLWQMEYGRRSASGRLSEVLGQRTLAYDRSVRTIGMRRAAEAELPLLSADARMALESYAAGVNAYIDTHRGRLPVEFTLLGVAPEPWTPVDTLAYGNVINFSLAGNHRLEYLRGRMIATVGQTATEELLPPYETDKPIIVPDEALGYSWMRQADFGGVDALADVLGEPGAAWGSNNWVVHGSRTASGKPILANDMHLNLSLPSIWYMNGLHGGRFDVSGFSFAGVPAVIAGHNDRIAWGETNLNPDVQDLYIERFDDPDNPTKYEYMGQWHDLETITETITVKGGAPSELRILQTRHGPIVNGAVAIMAEAKEPLALRWSGFGESGLFQAVIEVNLASDWQEFRAAIANWHTPSQNFVYADVDGNIGYQMSGRVPLRQDDHQGLVPVPGWTGEYEWQGFIPFEELPSSLNPPAGFLATANNKVVSDDYPYLIANEWDPGFRAKRITDLLAAGGDAMTLDDMRRIQSDTYSLPAEALRSYLTSIAPQDERGRRAVELVKGWDMRYEPDQVGGSIYQVWYWFVLKNTLNDDLTEGMADTYLSGQYERHGSFQVPTMIAFMRDPNNRWFDDRATPAVETRDDIIQRSLDDALDWLEERYGRDPAGWTWGRLHSMRFVAPPLGRSGNPLLEQLFSVGPVPARGDNFTVNAGSFSYTAPFTMNHGTSQRHLIDMSDIDGAQVIISTGQGAQLFHPHRSDLVEAWQGLEYIPLHFSRAQVDSNAESTLTLMPGGASQ